MSLEPQKFFIGLMDFFSILLPGAVLTYLEMDEVGPLILGTYRYSQLVGAQGWSAFVVCSYLFGHLAFLTGSWLDELYDWVRRYTQNTQIAMLAHRGKLLHWFMRMIVAVVFKRERNSAVNRVSKIKRHALGALQAESSINNFQWCKALLTVESPESLAIVQRFEADSKFFRCFVIVLLILVTVWAFHKKWQLAAVGTLLLPLASWRYMEQRFKSTNQAYWSVITLAARERKVIFEKTKPAADGLTHAGGVVYRMSGNQAEYLLVEAKDNPKQPVLPKGHIEEDEHPGETAVREVHEETGVWAKILLDLGPVSLFINGASIKVEFFLMEAMACGIRQDKNREHCWLSLEKASELKIHDETRDLLRLAAQRLEQLS